MSKGTAKISLELYDQFMAMKNDITSVYLYDYQGYTVFFSREKFNEKCIEMNKNLHEKNQSLEVDKLKLKEELKIKDDEINDLRGIIANMNEQLSKFKNMSLDKNTNFSSDLIKNVSFWSFVKVKFKEYNSKEAREQRRKNSSESW